MSDYGVIWAQSAEDDLIEIVEYIAADNISAAKKILRAIQDKAQSLTRFPRRGRLVPELQEIGIPLYRELIFKFWRIVYRIADHTVFVVGVFDSRRNLEQILIERLLR